MTTRKAHITIARPDGFTLIEVILVIVIIGILVGVVVQNGGQLFETAKVEQTKQELDALAMAITGNPELHNNGVRSDFGYVGDVGALPPDLDALYSNPGGFTTWNGPYIVNRFTQVPDDYKKDAWGTDYSYGGIAITSTGSGSTIIRRVANSSDELLVNNLSGNIFDADGTMPGAIYADSLTVLVIVPDGAGNTAMRSGSVNSGGYFAFDSLPIGNHRLRIAYEPTNDTIYRPVSVTAGSSLHSEYRLASNLWFATTGAGGAITKVTGSDSLISDCHGFYFWIENTTGGPIDISSLMITWSGYSGYYRYIRWDGTIVFDANNPSPGSGDLATFTGVQTINDGESLRVDIDFFKTGPSGGPNIDVENTTFTVEFSDGSTFGVTTGACP
jgi:general secretion pathway protein G